MAEKHMQALRNPKNQTREKASPIAHRQPTSKLGRVSVLLVILVVAVGTMAFLSNVEARQGSGQKWQEVSAGAVPTSFGDIVSVSGDVTNYVICFKDDRGTLRLVNFRGGKIPNKCYVIERKSE